jgi:hypothetical protein
MILARFQSLTEPKKKPAAAELLRPAAILDAGATRFETDYMRVPEKVAGASVLGVVA